MVNEIEYTLCRSAMYEAIALGFRHPTEETIARLANRKGNTSLAQIASVLEEHTQDNVNRALASHVCRLIRCPDARDTDTLRHSYNRLFGHVTHSQVPPYETEYGKQSLFQQPQQLGDISGFMRAFGLKLNTNAHERIDHISCECEFLAFLTRKEAYALEINDVTMFKETRKAQRLFLKDHLGQMTPAFSGLLQRKDRDKFYGVLGKLCSEFVLSECAYFGVPAESEFLRLRSTNWGDDCSACGAGEELLSAMQKSEDG